MGITVQSTSRDKTFVEKANRVLAFVQTHEARECEVNHTVWHLNAVLSIHTLQKSMELQKNNTPAVVI
ncbi:hypothetical protein G6F42_014736 [Rhizopus arrhizus]|nr:hypothetical protein G6F42_014736 [Rhizopus arrhizus]